MIEIKTKPSELVAWLSASLRLTMEQEIAMLQWLHTHDVLIITAEDLRNKLEELSARLVE